MSIDPIAAQRVTAGMDWAKDDQAVCVVVGQGKALERFTVRHDAEAAGPRGTHAGPQGSSASGNGPAGTRGAPEPSHSTSKQLTRR